MRKTEMPSLVVARLELVLFMFYIRMLLCLSEAV